MKTVLTLEAKHKSWGSIPVGTALRVRDTDAEKLVKDGVVKYCPKSIFKEQQKELETKQQPK